MPSTTDDTITALIPTALMLNANRVAFKRKTIVVRVFEWPVAPYTIEAAWRDARSKVRDLPEDFRIHDLRHYFASLLIAAGLDIKTVQARLRHAFAKTALDTYAHPSPDRDESSRTAVAAILEARKNPSQPGDAETGSRAISGDLRTSRRSPERSDQTPKYSSYS